MPIWGFLDFIGRRIKVPNIKEVLLGNYQPQSLALMHFGWWDNQLQSKYDENWQINGCSDEDYSVEFTWIKTKGLFF